MAIVSPRASSSAFRVAPPAFYGDLEKMISEGRVFEAIQEVIEWQRLTVEVVNGAMAGRINAVDTVTLTANQATTTLNDSRIGGDTVVLWTPTTVNAAAEVGNGTIYQTYPNATKEQAVLNHANNAQADRTFAVAYLG